MERQPSEGIELCVSCVNLRFDNPNMRMEEDGDNLEGVLRDMPSNEEAGQGEGLESTSNEVMPSFDSSKLSMKLLIRLSRSVSSHLKNPPLIPRHLKMKHGGKPCKRRSPPLRRMIHKS